MTLSILALSITIIKCNNLHNDTLYYLIQHSGIQHYETLHNAAQQYNKNVTLNIKALSIWTLSMKTLNIEALRVTLSMKTLNIEALRVTLSIMACTLNITIKLEII